MIGIGHHGPAPPGNPQPTSNLPTSDKDPHHHPVHNLMGHACALQTEANGPRDRPGCTTRTERLAPSSGPCHPESHTCNTHERLGPSTENISASRRLPLTLKLNPRQFPLPAKQQSKLSSLPHLLTTDQILSPPPPSTHFALNPPSWFPPSIDERYVTPHIHGLSPGPTRARLTRLGPRPARSAQLARPRPPSDTHPNLGPISLRPSATPRRPGRQLPAQGHLPPAPSAPQAARCLTPAPASPLGTHSLSDTAS
jgi:hypothetical protein